MKKREGLRIHYCGQEKCEKGHAFGPATRAHYLVHFILHGKGSYKVGEHTYCLEKGEAFLIKPGELTFYQADSVEPWEYVWAAFSGEEGEYLVNSYFTREGSVTCKVKEIGQTKKYLMKLLQTYADSEHNKEELKGWFYLVFSTILKEQREKDQGDIGYYHKGEKYIRNNYGYDIHVQDVADYIGIDRTYLFKVFKKYGGISPKQYLTKCRIHAAQDMLGNTELSITEIALSCGFHDSSMFCKSFLKEMNKSPMAYRRKA